MRLKKILYISLLGSIIFTGCSESKNVEEEVAQKNKKQVEEKPVKKVEETVQKNIFDSMSVAEKKARFKEILVPITVDIYNELEDQYQLVKSDIKNNTNREKIEKLKEEYNADSDETLLHALKPHPISIVLAQAAAESAWLTSRFTQEANNIFGVWSFNKNEPRIAASGLRGDKKIYLKKYETLRHAVQDYYKNLGRNWAYEEFRKQRTLTSDPYILSDHLGSYSEKKEVYTELLKSMIKYNKFEKYDINTIKIDESVNSSDTEDIDIKSENVSGEKINTDTQEKIVKNTDLPKEIEIDTDTQKEIKTETTINPDTNISKKEQ